MKTYADSCFHAKQYLIKPCDTVLLQQHQDNKLPTPFNNKPYTVVITKGSMITAICKGHQVTYNSNHFKLIPTPHHLSSKFSDNTDREDDDTLTEPSSTPAQPLEQQRRYPMRQTRRRPRHLQQYKQYKIKQKN
ncbi:UNVERIFIED_CONTAM: hypothetical protein FKN15_070682 [Acipenser sinensis]